MVNIRFIWGRFIFGVFLTFGVVRRLAWMHQSMQQLRLST